MVLYYPQTTVLNMGPTCVLSGSQYLAMNHEHDPSCGENLHPDHDMMGVSADVRRQIALHIDQSLETAERSITVEAGSICLMHYDLFHRASSRSPNGAPRFMFKFQYYRVNEPRALQGPGPMLSWPDDDMRIVQEEISAWMTGRPQSFYPALTADGVQDLIRKIRSNSEVARISAAYSLGRVARTPSDRFQQQALACLVEALNEIREEFRRAAAFGLVTAGPIAEPQLLAAAVSTTGAAQRARKYVLWALGEIDTVSPEASKVLLDASSGADHFVYANACVEKLAKATAAVALGQMAQRAHRANDDELFSSICEQLVASATPHGGRTPPEDLVREDSTLALLLACEAGPTRAAALPGLTEFLQQLASESESDRYVTGYASEALLSLAEESAEARAVLESVLSAHAGADLQRLVQGRRCPRTSRRSPFISMQSVNALANLESQQSTLPIHLRCGLPPAVS